MSILAASVCLSDGEILLSRQFVEMTAPRVHEMLNSCSLLLDDTTEHTTLEVNGMRYICEPLDELYVVLISDADTSNILQDLKTLHLMAQLVKQVAAPSATNVEKDDVINSTFSIIDAFDEVVTMGYHENLTESQVETFLKMESYEERIQQIIEHNKQLEAAEHRKRMAKKLEAERQAKQNAPTGLGSSSASGFGSESGGFGPSSGFGGTAVNAPFSASGFGSSEESSSLLAGLQPEEPQKRPSKVHSGSGLKLGRGGAGSSHAASGSADLGAALPPATKSLSAARLPSPAAPARSASASAAAAAPVAESTTTDISISEHLTIEALRDGTIKQSRVSGTLSLVAGNRDHAKLKIKATTEGAPSDYKPHPKMDRALFASERTLGLKNVGEGFPASQVLLVKWTADNVPVPLTVSCWVSDAADAGFKTVTLEYEVIEDKLIGEKLENITIKVPLPSSNAHAADPAASFEQFDDHIVWSIPEATLEDPVGSFEFVAEANEEDDFYPLEVSFRTSEQTGESVKTYGKIDVPSITDATSGEEIEFTKSVVVDTATYVIR